MSEASTSDSGLYGKYHVEKDGEPVESCFVLEPKSDPAAREALLAYADATDDDALAADLSAWLSQFDDTATEECVVCGSEEHDGEGWIYPTSDTEVVEITPDGVKRELQDNPRPLCSIECKDEFEREDGGQA